MRQYHYIMQIVWLITSVGVLLTSTWMGFQDGFDKWWMMYFFVIITLIQYFRHRVQLKKIKSNDELKNSPDGV
jgi:hypothetical protein